MSYLTIFAIFSSSTFTLRPLTRPTAELRVERRGSQFTLWYRAPGTAGPFTLLEVLDRRLDGRDYLLGDDYSIVDMATYPYARSWPWAKVSIDASR